MTKTRAIRLSATEEKLIEEFLEKNPFFDFSTLARTAIVGFIKNPNLTIRAVGSMPKALSTKEKRSKDVTV